MPGTFQQVLLCQLGWWCESEGEGRKVEAPASLCRLGERSSVLLQSVCTGAGREGEGMEPGGLSTVGRPGGDPLERRRCLFLLVMKSSSLSVLEGCSLQSFLGLFITWAGAGFALLVCLPGLKVALESCLFFSLTNGTKNDLLS